MKALSIAGSWLAAGLLWCLHFLPTRWLRAIGRAAGRLLYRFGRGRVTDINLRLCFPEWSESERRDVARRHFECLGQAAIDLSLLWFGSDDRVLALSRIRGREHMERLYGQPFILLAPHFLGIDIAGARISHDFPGGSTLYSRQRNPVLERYMLYGRRRFGNPRILPRQDGIRGIVKALRSGSYLYLLPDMDLGARDAVFVPFFGVPTATVTALPRIARLGGGVPVVPVVCRQVEDGYEAAFYPPWDNYPSDDLEADVRRMNAFIEERIREAPEQYFWAHKRFKTRPPGEPSFYRRDS